MIQKTLKQNTCTRLKVEHLMYVLDWLLERQAINEENQLISIENKNRGDEQCFAEDGDYLHSLLRLVRLHILAKEIRK